MEVEERTGCRQRGLDYTTLRKHHSTESNGDLSMIHKGSFSLSLRTTYTPLIQNLAIYPRFVIRFHRYLPYRMKEVGERFQSIFLFLILSISFHLYFSEHAD